MRHEHALCPVHQLRFFDAFLQLQVLFFQSVEYPAEDDGIARRRQEKIFLSAGLFIAITPCSSSFFPTRESDSRICDEYDRISLGLRRIYGKFNSLFVFHGCVYDDQIDIILLQAQPGRSLPPETETIFASPRTSPSVFRSKSRVFSDPAARSIYISCLRQHSCSSVIPRETPEKTTSEKQLCRHTRKKHMKLIRVRQRHTSTYSANYT